MSRAVVYEKRGQVGEIVLSRPDQRNSMTPELLEAFAEAVAEARADGDSRCLIVRGEGSCFSAGADLKANLQTGHGLPHERSYAMYAPFLALVDVEVPVIGALNGHAVGGGFGLALSCDIRIGNEASKYGANFARLGFGSGMAITYVLPRLVGVSRAAELLFTGRLVKGTEAAAIGLFSRALPGDQVLSAARELAEEIAGSAPLAVRAIKRALRHNTEWDPKSAARYEAALQADTLTTEDAKEGMAALLEKRAPEFQGN
jgi:enoyl-CoA hydratase/carnithine racemase